MLPPAYGLLKTVMSSGVSDIALQPLSISYDQVPEELTYSREISGGNKQKESTSVLLKASRIFRQRFGKIYLRFSEPILLDDLRAGANKEGADPALLLQKTAFQVSKSITEATPITPKAILSSVLLNHRLSALPLMEIVRLSEQLADYAMTCAKLPLTVSRGPSFSGSVESILRRLQKSGTLLVNDDVVPRLFYCEEKHRTLLNYYKNNGIHGFTTPAIFFLSLFRIFHDKVGTTSASDFAEQLEHHSLRLRNILKFEFFFNPSNEFLKEIHQNASYFFAKRDWNQLPPSTLQQLIIARYASWDDLGLFARFLGDILESYVVGLRYLKLVGSFEGSQKTIVQQLIRKAQEFQTQGDILFPESISIQNYDNLLKLLGNLGHLSLTKSDNKTQIKFEGWTEDLEKFLEMLSVDLDLIEKNPTDIIGQT